MITGESAPVAKRPGSPIISGVPRHWSLGANPRSRLLSAWRARFLAFYGNSGTEKRLTLLDYF